MENRIVLPEFPEFVKIDLVHRKIFEEYIKKYPQVISEFNFTELFAWRNSHRAKLCSLRKNLCILVDIGKDQFFFQSIGDHQERETMLDLLNWQKSNCGKGKIYGASDFLKEKLKDASKDAPEDAHKELDFEEIRNWFDYVYLANDLIQLKGKKYDAKRNQIKQFNSKYKFEFLPLSKELVGECLEFQKKWCEERGCAIHGLLKQENDAIIEMLKNIDLLDMTGAVIRIDSKVEAFSIAAELNHDTAVILVEKANAGFRGIYQAINQMMCEKMLSGYKFINREQDMGDAGLRKAKLSYHPHHLISKMVVQCRVDENI